MKSVDPNFVRPRFKISSLRDDVGELIDILTKRGPALPRDSNTWSDAERLAWRATVKDHRSKIISRMNRVFDLDPAQPDYAVRFQSASLALWPAFQTPLETRGRKRGVRSRTHQMSQIGTDMDEMKLDTGVTLAAQYEDLSNKGGLTDAESLGRAHRRARNPRRPLKK